MLFRRPPRLESKPEPVCILKPIQICAYCGKEATHQFVNGDLYLRRLEYNYLCDVCWNAREAARSRHNVANRSTVVQKAPRQVVHTEQ